MIFRWAPPPSPLPSRRPHPTVDKANRLLKHDPRGLRILLVEDHEVVALGMAKLLSWLGHQTVCASGASKAIIAASLQPFDVLICDYRLSDGSPAEVLQAVRCSSIGYALLMSAADEGDTHW